MAKDSILDWSVTAGDNTDVGGVNTAENNLPSTVNNGMREMMAQLAARVPRHVEKDTGDSPFTAVKADHNQFWRATGGAVTVNLTAAATLTSGWALWLKADGGAITVDPSGAETINGSATLTVADGNSAFVLCTGTEFFAIPFVAGVVASEAVSFSNSFALAGDISPAEITTDQDDYDPTGLASASVLRLTSDTFRIITGLAGGADGRILILINIGSSEIRLTHEGSGSTAANRFTLPGSNDFSLRTTGAGVTLRYDATTSRWRFIGLFLNIMSSATPFRSKSFNYLLDTYMTWEAAGIVTLTDAATISVDMSTFLNATVTLGGNRTLGNPTNTKVGQCGIIYVVQDGTGSRTLAYGSNYKFAGGSAPTLSTDAAAVDRLVYFVRSSTHIDIDISEDRS